MPSLRAFAASVDCALVVTQPERRAGRGHKLQPTPVKAAALQLGLRTFEPERLRTDAALRTLQGIRADVFAVASYGKIVPQAILDLAPRGALNVHPSLLPLYRGATPLQSQLRDGVTASGVTLILMDAGMDTGDIVLQRASAIGPRETYGELHARFAQLGAELLAEACALLAAGPLPRRPQASLQPVAEIERTLTRPLAKSDLILAGPGDDARASALVDKIRSLAPAPGARAELPTFGQAKILAAHVLARGPAIECLPGSCVTIDGWLLLRAADGWLALDEVVVPGRRAMSIAEFRAGNKLTQPEFAKPALERWLDENEDRLLGYAPA